MIAARGSSELLSTCLDELWFELEFPLVSIVWGVIALLDELDTAPGISILIWEKKKWSFYLILHEKVQMLFDQFQ